MILITTTNDNKETTSDKISFVDYSFKGELSISRDQFIIINVKQNRIRWIFLISIHQGTNSPLLVKMVLKKKEDPRPSLEFYV